VDQERPAARVGRDGALTLSCERRGAATVLAGCRSTLPLQVLTPLALDGDALVVSVLNPTGCVLGGDRLSIRVTAGADTHVLLTTPSATKVHRTDGAVAEQIVELTVGPGAVLEWLPDHTIPHTGAAYRQRLHARVGSGATLVVADAFAVGRVARDERWRFALLESALSVTDDDGWLLRYRNESGEHEETFKYTMIAVGQYTEGKYRPQFSGEEQFAGRIITERAVRSTDIFEGKRVAVSDE